MLLPDPDSPTNATVSPLLMLKSTPSTAGIASFFEKNRFLSSALQAAWSCIRPFHHQSIELNLKIPSFLNKNNYQNLYLYIITLL